MTQLLQGHSLDREGAPYNDGGTPVYQYGTVGIGKARCCCGWLGPTRMTTRERRRDHIAHKNTIRSTSINDVPDVPGSFVVVGHGIVARAAPHGPDGFRITDTNLPGAAVCQCGWMSPPVFSAMARMRLHRSHKWEILKEAGSGRHFLRFQGAPYTPEGDLIQDPSKAAVIQVRGVGGAKCTCGWVGPSRGSSLARRADHQMHRKEME